MDPETATKSAKSAPKFANSAQIWQKITKSALISTKRCPEATNPQAKSSNREQRWAMNACGNRSVSLKAASQHVFQVRISGDR